MTHTTRIAARFGGSLLAAALLVAGGSAVSACRSSPKSELLSRDQATQRVLSDVVQGMARTADPKKGLRAQRLGEPLRKGTRVRAAFSPEGRELVCSHQCWLFFIDEQPQAHFAHPVRIVLIDAVTGEQQMTDAQWWPTVDGRPVFSKLPERLDPATIIFQKLPEGTTESRQPGGLVGGRGEVAKLHDACDAWAVVVCGYDDPPDTFDEDTDGMYNVLRGLGIPDDHIFFMSPDTTRPGVDRATSIANVQWGINQVAAQADETDKVLFFYSSHGGIDSLSCVPGSPGGGSISASDLDTWLDAITCDELTVIVEACHSGSLIGRYADGTYVAAEDDLTGDGETNRAIFTSASTDTSSYPDVDGADDPNPGDIGSETIWGYVEAFSTGAADTNSDGEISFGEGWQYAWNNDVTRIRGTNTPQMVHTGLTANNVYNYCYRVSGSGDLFVSDGPGDVGHNSFDYDSTDIWVTQSPTETDNQDVVSGMNNLVHVALHNRGTSAVANPSLKVYWADTSSATSWPTDFHQIGATYTEPTIAGGGSFTHTWTWFVDPAIGLGHHFCLVAVADAPGDPMTGGPPGVTYVAPFDNNIGQKNVTIVAGHGAGPHAFAFMVENNTRRAQAVDLVVDWVGKPWGSVVLDLPQDLFDSVRRGDTKIRGLEVEKAAGGRVPGLKITSAAGARLNGLPLKPGARAQVSLRLSSDSTKPGTRGELRIRQEADGQVLGALTVRLVQVDPADCGWVVRSAVEVFADLDHFLRVPAAREASELFARALSTDMCASPSKMLEVLSQAAELEKKVVAGLDQKSAPDPCTRARKAIKVLDKALRSRDVKGALRTRGQILDALRAYLKAHALGHCMDVANLPAQASVPVVENNGIRIRESVLPNGNPAHISVGDKFPPGGDGVRDIWIPNSESGVAPARYAAITFPAFPAGVGPSEVRVTCAHFNKCRLVAYGPSGGPVATANHTMGGSTLQTLTLVGTNISRVDVIGSEIVITEVCYID